MTTTLEIPKFVPGTKVGSYALACRASITEQLRRGLGDRDSQRAYICAFLARMGSAVIEYDAMVRVATTIRVNGKSFFSLACSSIGIPIHCFFT